MKKLNLTVKSCADCPAKEKEYAQGYTDFQCSLQKGYTSLSEYIRRKKIHPNCPLEDVESSK